MQGCRRSRQKRLSASRHGRTRGENIIYNKHAPSLYASGITQSKSFINIHLSLPSILLRLGRIRPLPDKRLIFHRNPCNRRHSCRYAFCLIITAFTKFGRMQGQGQETIDILKETRWQQPMRRHGTQIEGQVTIAVILEGLEQNLHRGFFLIFEGGHRFSERKTTGQTQACRIIAKRTQRKPWKLMTTSHANMLFRQQQRPPANQAQRRKPKV